MLGISAAPKSHNKKFGKGFSTQNLHAQLLLPTRHHSHSHFPLFWAHEAHMV